MAFHKTVGFEIFFDTAMSDLHSTVELTIGGRGLPKMDFRSLTDPMAVLYLNEAAGGFVELGRTEMIRDSVRFFGAHFGGHPLSHSNPYTCMYCVP